jgi:cytochrome c oxidase subunit 2
MGADSCEDGAGSIGEEGAVVRTEPFERLRGRRARVLLLVLAAAVLAVVVLPAVAGAASPNIWRPHGSAGEEIRTLSIQMYAILAGVAVTVWVILAYVILKGRRRKESEVSSTKGNLTIEIVWTLIPAAIITVLFILTLLATEQIARPDPGAQFTAVGHRWWWEFDFTDLGFKTANEVYVAEGRPTSIDVESVDVIHSFWVPQMGGKVDMIPGRVNHIYFVPLREGEYLGECSEYCGQQHGNMRFLFVVVSPEEYSAWVNHQAEPAAEPTGAEAVAGRTLIETVGCGGCHTIRGTPLKGTFGPDLTHFGSRSGIAAYTVPNTPENLYEWLKDPQAVKEEVLMPRTALPEQSLWQLVAYLEELQ